MDARSYSQAFEVRWSQVDPNGHLRGSAYFDIGVDVRIRFLADGGLTPDNFVRRAFGPVVLSEQIRYLCEVFLGEPIVVNLKVAGYSADGSHWRMQHEFLKANDEVAAVLRLEGGWIDLKSRKLIVPPPELADAFRDLERTDDYEDLASFIKKQT